MYFQNSLHEQLTSAIKSSNYTYSEIAKKVGVSRTSVNKWLKTGGISGVHLIKVCEVLDLDPRIFLSKEVSNLIPGSIQSKALCSIQSLPKEKYYKLEEVIRLLEED